MLSKQARGSHYINGTDDQVHFVVRTASRSELGEGSGTGAYVYGTEESCLAL